MNDDGFVWLLFAAPAAVAASGALIYYVTGWQDRRDAARDRK